MPDSNNAAHFIEVNLWNWALGLIATSIMALLGLFYRHTLSCNSRYLAINNAISKAHEDTPLGARLEIANLRAEGLALTAPAAQESARIRLELAAYKVEAGRDFAGREQLIQVEERITRHLDQLEAKVEGFATRLMAGRTT